MAKLKDKYGNWVLVAGAAKGLGEAYCTELAKMGFNLLMIDNQKTALENLSQKLAENFAVQTKLFCIDLEEENLVEKVMPQVDKTGTRLMIYNAAFSRIKKFENFTGDELERFVRVNAGTPLKLVHAFSKQLMDNKLSGGILLMSSLAGLLGMQYIVPYAATKAFAWNLAESLYHELKPHKIDVMACIAGATATEAYLNTSPEYGRIKPQVQQPGEVAQLALKNLGKKALFIPGFSNRINYFILTRLLPRKWASGIANKTMKKMYSSMSGLNF
jgi:short-subunit dehydrogenase